MIRVMIRAMMACCGMLAFAVAVINHELWEAVMWWFLTWVVVDCAVED